MRRSRAAVVALLAAACFVGPWRSREPPRSQRRCVSWLEPLDPNLKEMEPSEDAVVLPVFPLGGPFMPFSQQRLNIFEPRYRALYNDILLSGSRRFVVTSVDPNSQEHLRLATCGVVFYLEELQEVSEKTQDQIKYVCEHKVIGRVRLKRVLNPQSWFDGSTYLKAETEAIEDTDEEVDAWQLEGEVMDTMRKLEPLYNDLQRPCWRPEVLNSLNSSRAEANGLWSISEMWVQLLDAHLRVAQSEVEGKMQETVRPYAKGDSVRISDLPESAQKQIEMLRNDFTEQAKGMVMRKLEFAQKMIQTDSHQGRLEYFKSILDDEYFTSIAKKSLKNLGE